MIKPDDVTDRQWEIYHWIVAYTTKNKTAPAVRDIVEEFGFHGPTGAMSHVTALRKKGLIAYPNRDAKGRAKSRAIRPLLFDKCPYCGQPHPSKDASQ